MKKVYFYQTKIGQVAIAENGQPEDKSAITDLFFDPQEIPEGWIFEETAIIKKAFHQLQEYFQGERKVFDLPYEMNGTEFQRSVWSALMTIPYGETKTYGEIAKQIGKPKASRAVGGANHVNAIAIMVPCHRVIGSSGKLTGYAGGLEIKEKLLGLEKSFK